MRLRTTPHVSLSLCALATCAIAPACKQPAPRGPGPDLQITSEALRLRVGDPVPRSSPFFDGSTVTLHAARGETLAFQVHHRGAGATSLALDARGVTVHGYALAPAVVKRSSSKGLFGATHGAGSYPDLLRPEPAPASNPALFEIEVARDAAPATITGSLTVDGRTLPVTLTIRDVTLPPSTAHVWAYYDPRELSWANLGAGTKDAPSPQEERCIATFARYGVTLTPDLTLTGYAARKHLLGDLPFIPVLLPKDPALVGAEVRGWIDATKGTGKLPFAIPIDEPRKPDARAKVKALSAAVRAAGAGPTTFLYAVTAKPHPDLGPAIDLYITLEAKRTDTFPRWTYNGAPPRAGAFILDALSPGARTWGWIGHRYNIPVWYVWDALYWHDRHNRKGAPLPGRALDHTTDAVSFNDGEDVGNLDGVLALPGTDATPCIPTLRLATIRRALQDRALIAAAARCNAAATDKLVERMVPRALGDIPGRGAPGSGSPSWPLDDASWETARRTLLDLASCAK
jgi:hypothetical protein